eukprot:317906-Chlamydomonas_euryale.AAC.1
MGGVLEHVCRHLCDGVCAARAVCIWRQPRGDGHVGGGKAGEADATGGKGVGVPPRYAPRCVPGCVTGRVPGCVPACVTGRVPGCVPGCVTGRVS